MADAPEVQSAVPAVLVDEVGTFGVPVPVLVLGLVFLSPGLWMDLLLETVLWTELS